MRLANKTALITGGNSGIGLATARLFVAEGAKVIITGRNQETLRAAAKELGPNALAVVADATDVAATEAAIRQGVEKFGKLDIVFANAGIPGAHPGWRHGACRLRTGDQDQSHRGIFHRAVGSALPQRRRLDHSQRLGDLRARQPGLFSLCREQGRRARDGAGDWCRNYRRATFASIVVAPGAIRTPIWGAATATPEAEKAFRSADRPHHAARPDRRA